MDIGSGLAIGVSALSVSAAVIKIVDIRTKNAAENESKECPVHGMIVDWLERIEKKLDRVIEGGKP